MALIIRMPLKQTMILPCSEFDTFEDIDIYQEHPEHKKVAAYIGKVRISRAAVDYEV